MKKEFNHPKSGQAGNEEKLSGPRVADKAHVSGGDKETLEDQLADDQEFASLLENRRSIYGFLARIYEREVTLDFLKECSAKDSPLLQLASTGELNEGDLKKGFEELSRYFKGLANRDLEQAKLELDVEYANLFLGVALKVHPSESSYKNQDHVIMDKPRDEVLFEYRKEGVDKIEEFTEPEDHIAIELQFMVYLCRKALEALEQGKWDDAKKRLEAQKTFLNKHLLSWTPKFTKDIVEKSKVDFYRGAAKVTNGFLEVENDSLQEQIRYATIKMTESDRQN